VSDTHRKNDSLGWGELSEDVQDYDRRRVSQVTGHRPVRAGDLAVSALSAVVLRLAPTGRE
jgi:hypothetical protein